MLKATGINFQRLKINIDLSVRKQPHYSKFNIPMWYFSVRKSRTVRGAETLKNTSNQFNSDDFMKQEYNPSAVEAKWYEKWKSNNSFHADVSKLEADPNHK